MLNRRTEEPPAPGPQIPPMRPNVPETRQSASIGASMRIKGEIHTKEELMVDGEVEGLVESQSLVTIGPKGRVRANIKAREVVIYGEVKGNVEVSHKLGIREQGSLIGDVRSAGISIDDGAYFKGNIDIVRGDQKAATAKVTPNA